jgi:hypothetical protein
LFETTNNIIIMKGGMAALKKAQAMKDKKKELGHEIEK